MTGVETAAIVTVIGGAILVGLCVYGLYKLCMKEKPYDQKNKDKEPVLVTTVDDLKAEMPPKAPPSNKPPQKDKKEIERAKKEKELEARLQKLEKELEESRQREKHIQQLLADLLRQNLQDELLRRQLQEDLLRRNQIEYQNRSTNLMDGNESDAENDGSSGSSSEDGSDCSVPRWSRMTEEERRAQMCCGCEKKGVRTILKCGHPLFCLECADVFLPRMGKGKQIKGCPRCYKKFDKETVSLRIVQA